MKYSLGLDIGTSSIGWAVINEDKQRIEDLGVRIFERPENPKNGASLAQPRRDARSARRRLKRRRERLNYLKSFFIEHQLLSKKEINELFVYDKSHIHKDPYLLRSKAIREEVTNSELFVALYHIAKRRGYKSNRKTVEEKDKENENGKVLSAIKVNQPLLAKHCNSVALTLLEEEKFSNHKRNKDSSYNNSFIRTDFEAEILSILKRQGWSESWIQELLYSNPEQPETQGKSGIFYQRPFTNQELINRMRGICQYEKTPRAQKASYTFDLFRLAQNLAHLTYNGGEKLTPDQIRSCIECFKKVKDPSYSTIRKTLGYTSDPDFHFDYFRGKPEKGEANKFGGLKFYHLVKSALKDLPTDWTKIEQDLPLFDTIGEILTVNKDDESLKKAFADIDLSNEAKAQLMTINVSGFCHLSIEALQKLTPYILDGHTYDKAVQLAYPGKFSEKLSGDRHELPPLSDEQLHQLTNPVVKRAISQTRKVINAIIRKYGSPYQIKVECANELAKSFKDRRDIEKQQRENAEYNERIKNHLEELGVSNPTGQQIIKYKLREQQNGKCLYCGSPLDVEAVFSDDKITEIDHVVPFSLCGNDSIHNKVLVCAQCNQEKRDHIPFEVWGDNEQRWQIIATLANDQKISPQKRQRLLCEKPPKEGWNKRALNDTRYISKFMTRYLKDNLQFSDEGGCKQKVIAPTGSVTSYLRKVYGIGSKDRDLNNCHHAVDACIIATVSQGQIQKISEWNKYRELGAKHQTVTVKNEDGKTYQVTQGDYVAQRDMLPPWENFAQEVRIRSGMLYNQKEIEKLSDFREKFRQFKSYDEEFLQTIHPLFVSRMPKRSTKGQAHEETLRSPKPKDNQRLCRKKLDKAFAKNYFKNPKESWLEHSVLIESDKVLYNQLKQLLQEKGEHAFDELVYKNNKVIDRNGRPLSPVRTIKVYEKKPDTSGIYLNHHAQFADNGKMVCVNIYRRRDEKGNYKFFAAPRYVHNFNKKTFPILPTPKGQRTKEKADFAKIRNSDGLIMATRENGFELIAQVFPNDYLKITFPDHVVEGYYVKYNTSNGMFSLVSHNKASKSDQDLTYSSIPKASDIEVQHISILGDNYHFE